MAERYTVRPLEATVAVEDYLNTCVDVDRFLGYCKECSSYARRWSCPPFDFDPVALWRRFDTLHLYVRLLFPAPDTELPELLEGMEQEKAVLIDELLAKERAVPGSLVLSAGSCDLCGDNCTRLTGKPCRCPAQMRHSIESLGGDVGKTVEYYLKQPLQWIRDGQTPDYLTLVGGLLIKDAAQ